MPTVRKQVRINIGKGKDAPFDGKGKGKSKRGKDDEPPAQEEDNFDVQKLLSEVKKNPKLEQLMKALAKSSA